MCGHALGSSLNNHPNEAALMLPAPSTSNTIETVERGATCFPWGVALTVSRSAVVLLKLRIGKVQNGRFYIRCRSSSQKNEAEELKTLTDYLFPLLV